MKERKAYKNPEIKVISMDMQHDIIQTSNYVLNGLDGKKKILNSINAKNGLFGPLR